MSVVASIQLPHDIFARTRLLPNSQHEQEDGDAVSNDAGTRDRMRPEIVPMARFHIGLFDTNLGCDDLPSAAEYRHGGPCRARQGVRKVRGGRGRNRSSEAVPIEPPGAEQ